MKRPPAHLKLSFQATLENWEKGMDYSALPVPLKITQTLGTNGPVAVSAQVNKSEPFLVSLFPVGGGRHYMRIKASVRRATGIKDGDRVRVRITVIDTTAEVSLPKDLAKALKSEGVLADFKSLPNGKQRFTLRWIDQAAKPETRAKRIQKTVEEAHGKRERR